MTTTPQITMHECGNSAKTEDWLDISSFIPKSCYQRSAETTDEEISDVSTKVFCMDSMPEDVFNILLQHCLQTGKIRDGLLITLHANFGERYSDVIRLKLCDLITADGKIKEKIITKEKKTSKIRPLYPNKAVALAVRIYLSQHPEKTASDYLFTSESNNKRYETEKYIDEYGHEKIVRRNGKIAYKMNENGNKIPLPLSHTQEENIIKDNLAELGFLLENDGRYSGGNVRYNTHSLRKLYGNKAKTIRAILKNNGKISADLQDYKFVQSDYKHSNFGTTQGYCTEFEDDRKIVCQNLNIGLEVLENYIRENILT